MSDVQPGIGTSRSVFNAPTTGYSTATMFASQSLINAQLSTALAHAFLATKVTTSTTANAVSLPPNKFLTSAAENGIGISKSVLNAQTTGSSTNTEFASLSLINAPPSITLELANHAIKDTILIMENVALPQSNKLVM